MVSILLGEQRYFEETLPISELKELLDAGSMNTVRGQAERIRGLKWLMAMISKGTDVSRFFPDVIRNIMTPNLELKKLVYMYVLHYADHDENSRSAALLAINAFQRDLSDEHELIRGLALRTLTSIRVEDIQAVQALAIRTCARDISPYVRKIAANAIPKICVDMPRKNDLRETFEDEVLTKLLGDASPSVIGSAASAILEVCPERFDIVGGAFDRLLNVLSEVDEWGQVAILRLLSRFARHCFTNPVITDADLSEDYIDHDGGSSSYSATGQVNGAGGDEDLEHHGGTKRKWQGVVLAPIAIPSNTSKRKLPTRSELDSFLDNESVKLTAVTPPVEESRRTQQQLPAFSSAPDQVSDVVSNVSTLPMHFPMSEPHKRLLRSALPMLKSRNSAVVIEAAATMWYCGQRSRSAMQRVAQAMIRLVRSQHREVRYCALRAVFPLIKERPGPFAPHLADFFVNATVDAPFVRRLKLEVMCRLVREKTLALVLRELETYVAHPNDAFAAQAVRTLGIIAVQNKRTVARDCLFGLAVLVRTEACSRKVLEEAVLVSRDVFCKLGNPLESDELEVLQTFLREFDAMAPSLTRARSSLVWLAREFFSNVQEEAGDILRSVALSFADDASEIKLQALSLAVVSMETEPVLSNYILELGQYDNDFDVRDWARFLSNGKATLIKPNNVSKADGVSRDVASPSPAQVAKEAVWNSVYEIDSLSFLVMKEVPGYTPLPSWSQEPREIPTAPKAKTYSSTSSSSSSSSSSSDSSSSSNSSSSSSDSEAEVDVDEKKVTENKPVAKEPISMSKIKMDAKSIKPAILKNDFEEISVRATKQSIVAPPTSLPIQVLAHARPPQFASLLSHVRGQGLQIDFWYSRETVPMDLKGMTPIRIRFINKLDDRIITRVRFENSDSVLPLSDPVEMLSSGFLRDDYRILVKFGGHWRTPVKGVVLAEEIGKLQVEFRAPAGELLTPEESLTEEEFSQKRKHLGGMNESSARLSNPKGHDIRKRVLETCNFHVFQASSADAGLLTETLSFKFAARRTDAASTLVLLEISVTLDGFLDFYVNCEYALAGQTILDELKTAFTQ